MPERIPSDRHETVVSVLREAAQVNGDVEAYVEPDGRGGRRSLTFAEWDRAADGVAGRLARRGVAKGDVVCLLLPSCIDYAVLYAALLRLGAITSGINPRMGAGEVASIMERAGACAARGRPGGGPAPCAGAARRRRPVPRPGRGGRGSRRAPRPRAGLRRSGGGCLDQWDHGPAQGGGVRPRQPGRGGPGHRRAQPSGRPPALAAALRPRGLHDPGLGRDRQRGDDRHHPHAVAGRRRHPHHGGRADDGRPGRAHAVGAHVGQRGARRAPTWARCASPAPARHG